jgi:hypothetical protein
MKAEIESVSELRFQDGTPVRSASAIAPLGDGWLVAQDDATHGAWLRGDPLSPGRVDRLRVLPPVDGLEVFSEAAGTKHLKPDFEAACEVRVDGEPAVVLLGSGATPARMRASLVRLGADRRSPTRAAWTTSAWGTGTCTTWVTSTAWPWRSPMPSRCPTVACW